ncbi:MAG: cupin domain-containing protein [Bacteroidaceae bacterium]|nr:cupin domain-containing protein [Bacteroidaceae bacterium]
MCKSENIKQSPYFFNGEELRGEGIVHSHRTLADLRGVFADLEAYSRMDPETEVYRVSSMLPVPEGTPGGVYMGITYISPGRVGNEYFMTKGHFHRNPCSAECYWGVKGEGMLILMDLSRKVWAERMSPGSLHYIPAGIAHRVANIGEEELVFSACWPSDAGHDYESIARNGFAYRLMNVGGNPKLLADTNR